ncbi:DUF302 domain-containing protein [Histophilus somni]|uniref:DUF302 domain-containing protein n=1 Tax=Histophilus somni TaxID=731 RepID=UPI00351B7567
MAHGDALQPQSFESKYNFDQTITVLTDTLTKKGMTIFAKIDHQKAAKDAGLTMQPATVIIYGAPKVGTPLMVKDPSLALQLPLKVLVTEAEQGEVKVLLNTAEQVVSHSKTPYSAVENSLAKAEKLIKATVSK